MKAGVDVDGCGGLGGRKGFGLWFPTAFLLFLVGVGIDFLGLRLDIELLDLLRYLLLVVVDPSFPRPQLGIGPTLR